MEPFPCDSWPEPLRNLSFPFVIIPISGDFRAYLQSDCIFTGCKLPQYIILLMHFEELCRSCISDSDGDDGVDYSDDADASESLRLLTPQTLFPELHQQLAEAIQSTGGSCFIKVDDSSPKDAAWLSIDNSLKCCSPEESYELLKGSDRIALKAENACWLIVKKWQNIDLSSEFRCFVANGRLLGISQRDDTVFYPHLQSMRRHLLQSITDFVDTVLRKYSKYDSCNRFIITLTL